MMESNLLKKGSVGGKPLSSKTVLQAHSVLSSALSGAVETGVLAVNVARSVVRPKAERYEASSLSWADIDVLLGSLGDGPFRTAVIVAMFTGLRRSEIAGLQWKDVDFSGSSISVRRAVVRGRDSRLYVSPTKNGRGRVVALSSECLDELRRHRDRVLSAGGAKFVFVGREDGPVDPDNWTKRFSRLSKRAGLEGLRFHDLRHTHASLMLADGVHLKVVSERLGHSSIAITADLYSHVAPTVQREAAERFGAAWRSSVRGG